MKNHPFTIRHIKQKDNYTFTIEWSDNLIADYRLSDLQKHCPCAKCNDEVTGRSLINEKSINFDVKAVKIVSVGSYALRVQFTSGCSSGIYDFDLLYKIAQRPK